MSNTNLRKFSIIGASNFCFILSLFSSYTIPIMDESESVSGSSHVWFFATPWAVACQGTLSMENSRQKYWSGLPFPSPVSSKPWIEPGSPALQVDSLLSEPQPIRISYFYSWSTVLSHSGLLQHFFALLLMFGFFFSYSHSKIFFPQPCIFNLEY